ncbi:AraC family transcriptional regulator [Paraflavitalea soli]|uniref:AraC family transcriptional regulator n=1 Tax=Paraflavitalea soli TaxID=2315862 RepID=A0A3B7MGR6_9BACT|nr:helix-turn-helix domain-containing protein [Paraflavitalea soli]AXY72513.1 AraC family transcriptional regulator [Paraflavitalea soli]
MEKFNLLSILSLIVVFISILFSVFLCTVKTKNKLANILLGLFILFNAIDISAWFLDQYMLSHLNLLLFKSRLSWLINPLFYLYALALCYSNFRLRPVHLLHAIPLVVANLVLIPRFYILDEAAKIRFLETYRESPDYIVGNILGHLQFVFYIVGIYRVLGKYKRIFLENYADAGSITYRWLFQLVTIVTVVHSIVWLKDLVGYTGNSGFFANAQLIVGLNATLLLCWFVLKALYNPTLFRTVDPGIQPVEKMILSTPVSQGPVTTNTVDQPAMETPVNQEMEQKVGALKNFMDQQEPFLEPSLTVHALAAQMKIPARDLSILINHHLGQHFFDFINEYRIRKAMSILKDPARQGLNIQEVFYEVGFNSKSSFNTAFKKVSGMTPTQYKNS